MINQSSLETLELISLSQYLPVRAYSLIDIDKSKDQERPVESNQHEGPEVNSQQELHLF